MTEDGLFSPEMMKEFESLEEYEDKLSHALGKMIIVFNRIEYNLGELIATFVNNERKDYFDHISIFTAAMGFSQKLDLLSALYLQRYSSNEKQCEIFKLLIKQLSSFEHRRNRWVHSRWGTHTFGDTELIRSKPNIRGRKGLKNHSSKADYEEIYQTCDEMRKFNSIGIRAIYRGCKQYVEMSEEDIAHIEKRLTS